MTHAADYVVYRSRGGQAVIAAAVLGTGMTMLDGTVVNVALRTIGADLGASLSQLQWITNGYLLSLASLILLGGALGDRFGRRRMFVIGTVWFALASLVCGLAPNPEVLIAARVLQGAGGAMLTPGSLAMIQGAFAPTERSSAIGAWTGLVAIAGAIGPLVGGLLIDYATWRWIFLMNVPLAVIAVVIAGRSVPESRDPESVP
ncbi:MAG: MFS transporter, partial [Ornithinimicrobium sp.]